MIKFFKQLFCRHCSIELNRWHICHGPNGMDPPKIEAEYLCKRCGKIVYRYDSIRHINAYKALCPQYERRIK